MGLRQSALSFDARFALTSTYGLTPWILISAVKRKLDIPIGSRADYSSVKRSARTRITPASIKSQSPLNPGPALSNQRMHYFCPHALFLEAMMRHSFQHDTAISDSPAGVIAAREIARRMPSEGFVYMMAVLGVEAVRIGRTIDLDQRLRWFEYRTDLRVEIVVLGHSNALDHGAKRAEADVFALLDDIHLRNHNPQTFVELVQLGAGYDWYLPDRRRIRQAFWSLYRGHTPRFVRVDEKPTFERLTSLYPGYGTTDQIIRIADDL